MLLLSGAGSDGTTGLAYSTLNAALHKVFEEIGHFSSDKVWVVWRKRANRSHADAQHPNSRAHLFLRLRLRTSSAISGGYLMSECGASLDDIKLVGRWFRGVCERHYVFDIKTPGALVAAAGGDATRPEAFIIHRAGVEPPEDLAKMVRLFVFAI
jgi:hypothetical protein